MPIDIPFTEVSRLIEAQVKGKTFPEDGSGSFATTIKQAAVAASGDRLLISLLVNVKKRGFFALRRRRHRAYLGQAGARCNAQILRFTDVALDVQSQAAFGLLGEAAKAAVPYLQKTLADQAVIDLKPFAEDAKKRMAAAVGEFAAPSRRQRQCRRSTICGCSASPTTTRRCASSPTPKAMSASRSRRWPGNKRSAPARRAGQGDHTSAIAGALHRRYSALRTYGTAA